MRLERHWQHVTALGVVLYPLSLIFRAAAAIRRAAYAGGLRSTERLPVPVIIVGNITVGGTGKTPLVLWLSEFLQQHGMTPAIVSRGYRTPVTAPRAVAPTSDPAQFGDEPVLLAQRSGAPVWVGADRVAVGRALLAAHPHTQVIISDVGLQHYRLHGDIKIAVVDGLRGLGNGLLLPSGPLREPVSRLSRADAVVVNGGAHGSQIFPGAYTMRLEGREFRNVLNPDWIVGPDYFQSKRVRAVAGIGHPPRFFLHLHALGMQFEAAPFPDHYAYDADDLAWPEAEAIVMTEKDAVKCAAFATEKFWALPVAAVPDRELGELVLSKLNLKSRHEPSPA
ncbi:MAG TPA: tetraacyldisaccharide 4'-kinase [Burkholderiales bacterium]|nr:tetraacyldisaccharide 4'-kinase [Burkholderiales bacterium]